MSDAADHPIKVPENPFWTVFKRFGRDELIAMFVNVIGTAIVSVFSASAVILSLAGPIIEKVGFFPAHFKDAWTVYKTTPINKRKKLSFYFKNAVKDGSVSLFEDILVHDPLYIILMYIGLKIYPQTPVWLLATASFIIAVILVAILEVTVTEIRYWLFKRRFKSKKCGVESYYEARFYVDKKEDPKRVLKKITKEFNLGKIYDLKYADTYFNNSFPSFSGRSARVRLRNRTGKNNEYIKSVQIVYTRASEFAQNKYDQFRYFPIKKEKIYFVFNGKMPESILSIKNKDIKKSLSKKVQNKHKHLKFNRLISHNEELLASSDKVNEGSFLVELKVHRDKKLLMKAMRFVMKEFSLTQTTKGKSELYPENFYD